MGKYTIHGKHVDNVIERYLEVIVDEIVSNIPQTTSIFLIGGFGRGEGSVKFDNKGDVYPLKDFDIMVIFDEKIPYNAIDKVKKILHKKFNHISDDSYMYTSFTVDINSSTLDRINLLPDIVTYELKVASHHLYGKDVRNEIKISREAIPLRSGARILFQKGISLIGQLVREEYIIYQEIPNDKKEMFIYEVAKVFVELGTALSILSGKYVPSYKERASLLKSDYKKLFPELNDEIPGLGEKIFYYTKFKLNPDFTEIKNPIALWFEARDDLIKVLKYYMGKYLKVNENNYLKFCERVKNNLKYKYYKPLIAHVFSSKYKIHPPEVLLSILNLIFQFYGNFCYSRNIYRDGKYGYSRKISFCCPTLNFFYVTLLMLKSVNEDNVNLEYLHRVDKSLGLKPKSRAPNGISWKSTRQIYLDALNYLPYMY